MFKCIECYMYDDVSGQCGSEYGKGGFIAAPGNNTCDYYVSEYEYLKNMEDEL